MTDRLIIGLLIGLCIAVLWILRYPSKATYLLALTLPLSPYIPLIRSAYVSREYMILNLSDLIVSGLALSSFLGFCLQKRHYGRYPLLKTNIAVLMFYFILLVITFIVRPTDQSVFQLIYLCRYSLYFIIGYYVWRYLPVKDIERYILILLFALIVNSVYGIYEFINYLLHGGTTVRANGLWGLILGAQLEPGISDPGNFAMYIAMSLLINMFYISFMKPSGAKKTLAIISLFLGFITLHMTMSRTEIVSFWIVCLYLLLFMRSKSMHRMIMVSFLLMALAGLSLVLYFGIDVFEFAILRLYSTPRELLHVEEGRFSQVYNLLLYLQDHFIHWWGHGISSWRLYKDEFYSKGIISFVSGGLYSGYSTIFWDAGLIGILIWIFWIKKHFLILKNFKKKVREVSWMTMSLKAILICILVVMLATSTPMHNFRLMGYFSFLMGLLLKYSHHKYKFT